nr:putative ribonuclease H-like domain-containing protein [Tanacetum cinerariifolium]
TYRVNAISRPVTADGPNPTNSTNSFNTASPSDTVVSLNFRIARKYSFVDPSKYPDDPDMPKLEDIVYSDDEEDVGAEVDLSNLETNISGSPIATTKVHKDHNVNQIIGDLNSAPQTRSMTKMVKEQGGLHQINDEDFHTCSKWVFRNKKDERGIVIKNKVRLVAQGHTQEEGIDYDEVFALVARIKAIQLFLAYASFMGFMVYQMDVQSAFLYGTIEEEVYVFQSPGFEDPDYPDKVYKVVKALYGLHQAPRAWYETLANYLLENGFQKGKIDKNLFIKKQKGDILLVHVYVDDIIFGSTNKELCKAFEKLMKDKFQMSSMGELTFFLRLQVKQKDDEIFISQDRYVAKILRKFGFTFIKSASTPIKTKNPLLKDLDGEDVDVHIYSKELASPKQTALGNDKSNPFMAGSFPKTICYKLMMFGLTKDADVNFMLLGRKFNYSKYMFDSMVRNMDSPNPTPTPHTTPPALPPQEQPTTTTESSMSLLTTLMETCVTLSKKVAELEQDKHTKGLEILKLKKRVKKLEKNKRSKSLGFKRLRKVGTLQRVESSANNVVEVVEMDAELHGKIDQDDDVNAASKGVNAADPTIFDEEEITLTMAQTLIKMKSKKKYQSLRKYQSLKKKHVFIAQARKNMIIYLKNMDGYKMEHFKGMTYDKESFKKLKAVEVSGSKTTKEVPSNDPKEISEEDVQNMLEIVSVSKFKVEHKRLSEADVDDVLWKLQRLLLRFAKERLRQIQNLVAFCLQIRLRFATRFVAFCFETRCVLLPNTLRFASKHVAFCLKTLAFCLKSETYIFSQYCTAFCLLLKAFSAFCGPYKPTTILVQAVVATDDSPAIPEHTTVETPMNMSPENKAHFQAEKEAIHMILTRIGDEIYSTVDACQTAQEMFVTIVKQQHKLDEVSYHKLFDILKQYQKEVNELCAKRLARIANALALVATAQANQDPYYQTSKYNKSYAPSSKPSIPTKTHTTTRYKGKEIAKPITTPSETASEEDIDPEKAQRDKDMQKNLALIAKYFKKIYKPINNNLRTSSNSRNKNVDTTLRYKNDNQSGQFRNQRTINVAGARKPKRVKDSAYHKEKMLLCKQAEQGVSLQVQNDTGYNVFANDLQHFEKSESISNTCLVETDDSNVIPDSPDMYEDAIQNDQNDVESDDERVTLANLIANLKLDVDKNKKIQKQLKKTNITLAQELK